MRISILTLFPEMFSGPFDCSIVKRAKDRDAVTIHIVNIRDFAKGTYKSVDDHPYGGGVGMILRVDVLDAAMSNVKYQTRLPDGQVSNGKTKTVLLDPRGKPFTQAKTRAFAKLDHLILVCGHYEGVDERVKSVVDESVSIGDYILTGGELPAMVIADSIIRLLPGVLKHEATANESFTMQYMREYPQYTRPEAYKGMRVPDILLSGNHEAIAKWQRKFSIIGQRDPVPRQLKQTKTAETLMLKDPDN